MDASAYERDESGNIIDPITCEIIPEDRAVIIHEGTSQYVIDIKTLVENAVVNSDITNPFTRQPLASDIIEKMEKFRLTNAILVRVTNVGELPFSVSRTRLFELDPFLKVGDIIIAVCRHIKDVTLVARTSIEWGGGSIYNLALDTDISELLHDNCISITVNPSLRPSSAEISKLLEFCRKYSRNECIVKLLTQETSSHVHTLRQSWEDNLGGEEEEEGFLLLVRMFMPSMVREANRQDDIPRRPILRPHRSRRLPSEFTTHQSQRSQETHVVIPELPSQEPSPDRSLRWYSSRLDDRIVWTVTDFGPSSDDRSDNTFWRWISSYNRMLVSGYSSETSRRMPQYVREMMTDVVYERICNRQRLPPV